MNTDDQIFLQLYSAALSGVLASETEEEHHTTLYQRPDGTLSSTQFHTESIKGEVIKVSHKLLTTPEQGICDTAYAQAEAAFKRLTGFEAKDRISFHGQPYATV